MKFNEVNIIFEDASEIPGVNLLISDTGKTYLMAKSQKKVIPRKTYVGSFGKGQYDENGIGVKYTFPAGDKSIVQFDEQSLDTSKSGAWGT